MARVLLADSQPLFNEALETVLGRSGAHQVTGRASSEDDLESLVRSVPFDLLLIDAGLALAGRPKVLERVSAELPGVKVVVLSSRPDVDVTVAALRAGAAGVVSKTSGTHVILRVVEAVLRGEAAVSRGMLGEVLRRLVDGQRTGAESALARLSARETQVLTLLGQGWSNRMIGNELYISPHTVRTHVQNILEKLGLHTRLEAATYAMRELGELTAK
jgi:DNA-binding NarL/FixJ family response regulator